MLGHLRDLAHERVAIELAALHLRELVLPLAGQLGHRQLGHAQASQQRQQLEGLGRRDQVPALSDQVVLVDQALDHLRPRGRCAQALGAHGLAQVLVVDELARTFHRRQQRRLVEAGRWPGGQRQRLDGVGAHGLVRLDRDQRARAFLGVLARLLLDRLAAVDREPAGVDQDLALGLERVCLDSGDPRGDAKLGRREEHRQEALDHQVVDLLLGVRQGLGRLQRRDDRVVVGDLRVVEDALVAGLDPVVLDDLLRELPVRMHVGQHLHRLADGADVILGQRLGVGPRVGQDLVPLVQRLGQRQGGLGREAEAPVGVALQAGQVEERRRGLRGRARLLGDGAGLAFAVGDDRARTVAVPEPLGPQVGVRRIALEPRIEPAALVGTGLRTEGRLDLEVGPRHELADPLLALDDDRQRRGLYPADGGQVEAAVTRVERGHRARAVDADQPVGLRAAAGGVGERQHLPVLAQRVEAVADRAGRHGLQPEAADRLPGVRMLDDQPEDQLALAPGVAGVDQRVDVLALDQPCQQLEPVRALLDRLEIELGRDDRQVGERPLPALDLVLLRRRDLDQVADRRRQDELVALEVVALLGEAAQRPRDVGGHGGLLGDDQGFSHRILGE